MRTKIFRGRKMLSAADTIDQARPFVATLVERYERETGSKMVAYERIASTIGVTPSWLRKLVGRDASIRELAAHEYLNIVMAYRTLCERIEASAAHDRAVAARIRREGDAALESAGVEGGSANGARVGSDLGPHKGPHSSERG